MKYKTNDQTKRWLVFIVTCWWAFYMPPMAAHTMHEAMFVFPAHTVTGTVTSTEGEPLVGVTIMVKETTKGTVTDFDGKYMLELDNENEVLVFSYTGYETQEVAVSARSVVDVTMAESITALEEVVVVGYGTQKKANLTGAVSSIGSEALENRPIVSTGAGLQGLIPNLNITVRNGDPTQAADFNIRGFESINGGSPLILVDGVPMNPERINPNDIESVTVLKDASAAAVYGARAAFGVILIETKGGQKGKVNINFGTQLSRAKPIFNMDPMTDPYQLVQAWNTAEMRSSGRVRYDDDFVAGTKAWSENPGTAPAWVVKDGVLRFYGNNDYQNQIMTDFAPQQQYDLTVSGATDNASYYASVGFLDKDGYLRYNNEDFQRYNVLLKTDFRINDWLSLDEKIVFNAQNSDKPHFYNWDVNINSLARVSAIMPIQFPDLEYYITPGDREQYEQYIGMYFGGTNFFPYLLDGGRTTFTTNDTWLTQGVTLTPIKGLRIRGDFSYNTFHRNYQDVASKIEIVGTDLTESNLISNGFSGDDWIENSTDYNQYYVLNSYAEYTFTPTNHYFRATIGYNQEWGRNTFQRARASSLITPLITDLNATTGVQQTWGNKSHVALQGAFYRINYIFKDRYLIETNGRYDGTSRFPEDDRFGFFPSVSVGWRISEETFMAGTRGFLDNLKVRASYGTLGNQLLGNDYYPYIATLGIGNSPYILSDGRIPFVSPAGLVSPSLTWETVTTRNLGVDITVLNQKLDASFDIYTRETKDMLMEIEYPDVLGTAAPKANAADLRTTGWEASITWRDRITEDLRFDWTVNFSDWISEITRYENPSGALSEYYVGQRLGEIWGYETVGIFQTNEEVAAAPDQSRLGANWRAGDIQYADLNGDGIISPGSNTLEDPGDRRIIGNSNPRYSFGTNLNIRYKGFSLSSFFQGYFQRDHWPTSGNWTWFFPFNAGHVENYFITDSWSETNRDAYFAAPHVSTSDKKNIQTQTRFLQNAGYIRLKNLTLAYDLPNSLINRVGLSRTQVFLAGMNLWEYSPIRKPLDPETIFEGAIEYPMQRIFTAGANISF